MAVIKYRDKDGNFQSLSFGGTSSSIVPTWTGLKEKPFEEIDASSFIIEDDTLKVNNLQMSKATFDSAWAEVFGEE